MAKALLTLALGALCLLASFAYAAAEKKQPAWGELNGEQRQILAPLESDWDQMEPQRKKKWVGIAKRYPKMKNDPQQRVQQQMQAWAKLTPAERRDARERYQKLSKLPPEQKKVVSKKWQEYQQLPEEQKQQLSASAKAAPTATKAAAAPTSTPAPVTR